MVTTKLDMATVRQWEEETQKSASNPSLDMFLTFLRNKADLLETLEFSKNTSSKLEANRDARIKTERRKSFLTTSNSCTLCKNNHKMYKCPEFGKLSIEDRIKHVQTSKLCINCLNSGHELEKCKFGPCRKCSDRHNSLLHQDSNKSKSTETPQTKTVTLSNHNSTACQTLLSTALVKIRDKYGNTHSCRVLLDSASESNFITKSFCQRLGLSTSKVNISIIGISQIPAHVQERCNVEIASAYSNFTIAVPSLVITDICDKLPSANVSVTSLNIPSKIFLADPNYNISAPIDMLIGANLFYSLLCIGQIKLGNGLPILQKTKLGWVISGPIGMSSSNSQTSYCHLSRNSEVQTQLQKFWEIEEVDIPRKLSQEEEYFESHFTSNVTRHVDVDNTNQFPQASNAIAHSFYVDDLLHGSDDRAELTATCSDIANILRQAGFILRKWVSNDPDIVQNISHNDSDTELLKLGSNENSKTLGIFWAPKPDTLSFKISADSFQGRSTERSILSGVSQIYDPLGLLSACIISIKILLQTLWSEKVNWDESVAIDLHTKWVRWRREILCLNKLEIPRHVRWRGTISSQLHCFCDASQDAYATCIYIRSTNQEGTAMVRLLCAKSKVSPLKTLTIPRLELQGALLMSKLATKVRQSLQLNFDEVYYWTDSTIVLGWLHTSSSLLKTFVSNRVSEIQSLTDVSSWKHVSSGDNPADLASRGINPSNLLECDLWWKGPKWLQHTPESWPSNKDVHPERLPETKTFSLVSRNLNVEGTINFDRFSNYMRLVRSIAYCFRFHRNCKKFEAKFDCLSREELHAATSAVVKLIQRQHFQQDYVALSSGISLHRKSSLLCLNPFIDNDGVIRVGGRLSNSAYSYDKRHPMLLPKAHRFVDLLFKHEHNRLLHAGPTQLLSSVRERFWPISGKLTAKRIVHSCIQCFKTKPSSITPLMGDLPATRITPSFPFQVTGVDYAGPVVLKDKKGRGSKDVKAYVSLFICFSTKAIHLELVSNLSTECFISALRRFIARRGKPSRMMSDNGKNFLGARNELHDLGKFLHDYNDKIVEAVALEGIEWSFIPPYSPHFGGLWESGVKSVKHHLKRVLTKTSLIYEEFLTVLIQVEGILNSRPLYSLSTDPNDLLPLTPSHFLIGRPATSIPDHDLQDVKENQLNRYQYLQQLMQHFWSRWSSEYIHELQVRKKWKRECHNLQKGSLVLIKEKNQPPLCWALGRVIEVHFGKDNVPRVVTLRTTKGTIRRAAVNLSPLPLACDDLQLSQPQFSVESTSFQSGGVYGAPSSQRPSFRAHERAPDGPNTCYLPGEDPTPLPATG
nr:unnamed protein product [Callosobruchus chinensis]